MFRTMLVKEQDRRHVSVSLRLGVCWLHVLPELDFNSEGLGFSPRLTGHRCGPGLASHQSQGFGLSAAGFGLGTVAARAEGIGCWVLSGDLRPFFP